jgi:hypothetical protein
LAGINIPMHCFVHCNMGILSEIDWYNFFSSPVIISFLIFQFCTLGQEVSGWTRELRWGWKWTCSIVPYLVFLAILRYRASYHRKSHKLQDIDCSISGSRLWIYLKEIFHSEAKMSPSCSSHLLENCNLACYCVVWIVLPRPIASVYLMTAWISVFIQTIMVIIHWHCFTGANDLVYNGRRYAIFRWGVHYSLIRDGEGSALYYPTASLCGLVSPEYTQRAVQ